MFLRSGHPLFRPVFRCDPSALKWSSRKADPTNFPGRIPIARHVPLTDSVPILDSGSRGADSSGLFVPSLHFFRGKLSPDRLVWIFQTRFRWDWWDQDEEGFDGFPSGCDFSVRVEVSLPVLPHSLPVLSPAERLFPR